jgi:hypothetical protein
VQHATVAWFRRLWRCVVLLLRRRELVLLLLLCVALLVGGHLVRVLQLHARLVAAIRRNRRRRTARRVPHVAGHCAAVRWQRALHDV